MDRHIYQDLAASGLRMPIGTDLVLRETDDPEAALLDGVQLAEVIITAARRYQTPLALPVMDLSLEKTAMLMRLGVVEEEAPQYHFAEPPPDEAIHVAGGEWQRPFHPRLQAQLDALAIVDNQSDLLAVGMVIGPFSLMTKLMVDPIVPVYLAGSGSRAQDEPEILTVERCLEMAVRFISHSIREQVAAGARAVLIAEPAANIFYVSPRQMAAGSDIFERCVMGPNRRIRRLLGELGADLFFHCCGELTDDMVRHFASLDPAILSLGSSRKLWADAAIVPSSTVLFGNLPSKRFYSDREMTRDDVARAAGEILARMREIRRPFILGSECDVLSVPGCHEIITAKVQAMLEATPDGDAAPPHTHSTCGPACCS